MRKYLLAGAAVCLLALTIGLPTASASLVNRSVDKCEADATWQLTLNFSGASYADVTRTPGTGPGCRLVNATVNPDGTFSVSSINFLFGDTIRYNLIGVGVTGNPSFVGVATRSDGADRGPIAVVGGVSLTATTAGVGVAPGTGTAAVEYSPTGTCGTNCYTTHAVWVGTWSGP
jgi:hypothetical protein